MNKDEIHQLFRRTCAAIEDQSVDDATVAALMKELEATGDEDAIMCAKHTMQWRSPDNRPGRAPTKTGPTGKGGKRSE